MRLVAALFLALLTLFAANGVNPQIIDETGEVVDTDISATDMTFFMADEINLTVNSVDDVFATSGVVKVDATKADHLVLAGSEISLRKIAVEDLFAAGGELDLTSGTVADDIVIAGGSVFVQPTFLIGSSAAIAGGEVHMDAATPDDLRIGAGDIYLNAAVGGDARLSGGTVTLGPNTQIDGDLLYRTDNLVIEPGAIILGQRKVLPAQEHSAVESWGRGASKLFAMFALASTLGFAILVVAIAAAVPSLMRSSAELIRTSPLRSLGLGILIAVGVPFVIALLFAVVIGAPLGMLLAAICLAITPVALAATSFLIGMEARRILSKENNEPTGLAARLLWPALGAAAILLLGMIPFLGLLVWLLAMLIGLGAVVNTGGKALATNA